MAELDVKKVFKKEVMSVKDFAAKRGVSSQAVHYAINKDFIDSVSVGFEVLVVMTKKTLDYLDNPKRSENGTRRTRMKL